MQKKIIAIDGLAGSGKSTIAKLIAQKLNYKYFDSGALYRAIAYLGLSRLGSNFPNQLEIVNKYLVENPQTVQVTWDKNNYTITLAGEVITSKLRDEKLNGGLLLVANYPAFRNFVYKFLIRLNHRYDLVIDGRDIGTVVFPNANKKFYCTASIDERVKRRSIELSIDLNSSEYQTLRVEIEKRDENDLNREVAPLLKASDAIHIDTSGLTIESAVAKFYSYLSNL